MCAEVGRSSPEASLGVSELKEELGVNYTGSRRQKLWGWGGAGSLQDLCYGPVMGRNLNGVRLEVLQRATILNHTQCLLGIPKS